MSEKKYPYEIKGKNPFKHKPIPKGRMEWAIEQTLSMKGAARLLQVSYPTFKKYAKLYDLFNPNMGAVGIPKTGTTGYGVKIQDLFDGKHPKYPHYKLQEVLIKTGHMIQECNNCGYTQTRDIDNRGPFLLDFLDNDGTNHSPDNMRLLCYCCFFLIKPAGKLLNTPKDVLRLRRQMWKVFDPTKKEKEIIKKEEDERPEFPKEGINPIDEQEVDLSKIKDTDVGVNFDELFKEMGLDEDD